MYQDGVCWVLEVPGGRLRITFYIMIMGLLFFSLGEKFGSRSIRVGRFSREEKKRFPFFCAGNVKANS